MTNEEKILEILGVMQSDMAEVKADVKSLHAQVDRIETDMAEVKDDLKGLHAQVDRIETDMAEVKDDLKGLHTEMREVKDDLKGLHAEMREVKDDLKGLHTEMREVKDDLKGLHTQADKIDGDLTWVRAHLEVNVERRLDALGEGHELLLQTLAHNDRLDEVEDDMGLLRAVVKEHSRQIAALKRAL